MPETPNKSVHSGQYHVGWVHFVHNYSQHTFAVERGSYKP